MPDQASPKPPDGPNGPGSDSPDSGSPGRGTAVAPPKPKERKKRSPKKGPPGLLPPWKVLLHNDDHNAVDFVIVTIVELTTLNEQAALQRTLEAHRTGVALLVVTHKERAELYKDQFTSKGLTVSIEPEK